MRNRTAFVINALAASLLFSSVAVRAEPAQPDPAAVARGAESWSESCARCHNMRAPREFRDDLWRPIVAHMRVRAGLTGQEARDILVFLQNSN